MIAWLLPLAASAQYAYASNEKDGTISVIDTATDEAVGSIKAGKTPRGMAASVDGKRLYVSDQKSNALRIIDLASRSQSGSVELGESPEGVGRSPDGKWIAVAIEEDHQVLFVDTSSGKVAFKVKVEGENPEHAVFSPDGKWVYVSAEESQVVDVIDVATRQLAGSIRVGKRPRGIGFTPDGTRAYVACEVANTVYSIDVANRKVLATIPGGGRSNGIKVHPSGREVYFSNGDGGTVMVIDTATDKVTATIKVGNRPWNMGLTADGAKLYVANGRSNSVRNRHRAKKELKQIKVGEQPGASSCRADTEVSSFRANAPKPLSRLRTHRSDAACLCRLTFVKAVEDLCEHRSGRDMIKQRRAGPELQVVRSPENFTRRPSLHSEQRPAALPQPRPKHRITQVRAGLGNAPDRIVLRCRAGAESEELGKDEPHPVRAFAPVSQFRERRLVHAFLGLNEPSQIVRIGAHYAHRSQRMQPPRCGNVPATGKLGIRDLDRRHLQRHVPGLVGDAHRHLACDLLVGVRDRAVRLGDDGRPAESACSRMRISSGRLPSSSTPCSRPSCDRRRRRRCARHAALGADVQRHVLDDAEDRDADLLEHLQSLHGIDQRDVLRSRDDDGTSHRHLLRERQLDVASARRHVDHEVVEVLPVGLTQQLLQRLRHHRAAPHHRLVGIDQQTDRAHLYAVVFLRFERASVHAFGRA